MTFTPIPNEIAKRLVRIPRGEPYASYFRDPVTDDRYYKAKAHNGAFKRVERVMSDAERKRRTIKPKDGGTKRQIEKLLTRYRQKVDAAWAQLARDLLRVH